MSTKLMYALSALVMAAMTLVTSCSKEGDESIPSVTIPAEFANLSLEDGAIDKEVKFVATTDWSVTLEETTKAAPSWVKVSPMSGGAGSVTLNVEVEENTSGEERSSSVTINAGGEPYTIEITQKAGEKFTPTMAVGDLYIKDGVTLGQIWKINGNGRSGIIFRQVEGIWEEYIDVEYAETRDKNSGLVNMKTAITKDPTLKYHHSFRSVHELNVALDAGFSGESYTNGAKNVYYLPAIEEMVEFLKSEVAYDEDNMYACLMSSTGGNVSYNYYFSYVAYYTPFLIDGDNDGLYGSNSFDMRDVLAFMIVDIE